MNLHPRLSITSGLGTGIHIGIDVIGRGGGGIGGLEFGQNLFGAELYELVIPGRVSTSQLRSEICEL